MDKNISQEELQSRKKHFKQWMTDNGYKIAVIKYSNILDRGLIDKDYDKRNMGKNVPKVEQINFFQYTLSSLFEVNFNKHSSVYYPYMEDNTIKMREAAKKTYIEYLNEEHASTSNVSAWFPSDYSPKYWLYSAGEQCQQLDNCKINNIMIIGWGHIGDLRQYSSKDEISDVLTQNTDNDYKPINASLALWEFAYEVNIGDIVYLKKGYNSIVARGVVTSEYYYDDNRDEYSHIRDVEWVFGSEYSSSDQLPVKTLTMVSQANASNKELVIQVEAMYNGNNSILHNYTKKDFLSEVFIDEDNYDLLVNLLRIKNNIILQGAPGVGKTFIAKRLAYSIMGEKDDSKIKMIQFHQSYSYEDFIMGYRPCKDGFELKNGPFYEFCKKAENDPNNMYFFIIDEINRGNISKIFGELFMLIEQDKRGEKMQLLYSDDMFTVPSNLYIIGTMNTADRSLAMLDYALRRRFAFYEMEPAFNIQSFKNYLDKYNCERLQYVLNVMNILNDEISKDVTLGDGFRIGHSYFCNKSDIDNCLNSIINYEIIPLLQEYWFDEKEKADGWIVKLREAIK